MKLSENWKTCSMCGATLNEYWNCLECSNIEYTWDNYIKEKAKKSIFSILFWWFPKKEKLQNYCECWNKIWKNSIMCKICYKKYKLSWEI
jgi:hypothetical protein